MPLGDHAFVRTLVRRIVERDASRTEADLQSDIQTLLLWGGLNLDDDDLNVQLESQLGGGTRRRIDIEVGHAVIETKRSLKDSAQIEDAVEQLAGYVAARSEQLRRRYVGILTDGATWRLYHLSDRVLDLVSEYRLTIQDLDVDALLLWLEGVLATTEHIPPTPAEISRRLGAGSSGFSLELATLVQLHQLAKNHSEVRLKRELWAKLLTTALGTQFDDSDHLFIEHTYLVTVAELVAHAAVGFSLSDPTLAQGAPRRLTLSFSGHPRGGRGRLLRLGGRLRRCGRRRGGQAVRLHPGQPPGSLRVGAGDHDVLKALYESVISAEQRHRLGEYYTPDWLAQAIVEHAIADPLHQRVLDPSCGSGTFLFHAIRSYTGAAAAAGLGAAETISGVTSSVLGVDLHPVAVTLARVTYLLAIGKDLYTARGPEGFSVPVYLGDSVQWRQTDQSTLFGVGGVRVPTDDGLEMFAQELVFPEGVLSDVARFDALVSDLAAKATGRKRRSTVPKLSRTFFTTYGITEADQAIVQRTFQVLCDLHDNHRNQIWAYYVRNLARPMWLARQENHVDVLVGNPPWVAYRFMPEAMQETFRTRGDALSVRPGGHLATQADLAPFFVLTAVETYLRSGGRFGFLMPRSAVQGAHYAGFRTGAYPKSSPRLRVEFDRSWDLAHVRPNTYFQVPASVVFGRRSGSSSVLGAEVEAWRGHLPDASSQATWSEVETSLSRALATIRSTTDIPASPYHAEFRNGATLQPRMLLFVRQRPAGPLGVPAGRTAVRSRRSGDKPPWNELPDCTGEVETQFLHPGAADQDLARASLSSVMNRKSLWRCLLDRISGRESGRRRQQRELILRHLDGRHPPKTYDHQMSFSPGFRWLLRGDVALVKRVMASRPY